MPYLINVISDYGADPTNSRDSSSAFQAAFDAAFGSSLSPHGSASATSNIPVFIPNGRYRLSSTLNLTRVVGGYIYGAGPGATILSGQSGAALLAMNGCSNLIMERMTLDCGNTGAGNFAIDLDWDNTAGGDGLHNNVFRNFLIQSCNIGIRIAHSGHDGASNLFENVTIQNTVTGIDAQATSAINNTTISGGGGSFSGQLYWSSLGQINSYEPSVGSSPGANCGVRVDSGLPIIIGGGRSEGIDVLIKLTSGQIIIEAFDMNQGTAFANITGGKLIADACVAANSSLGKITGNAGTVYLRGCGAFDVASYSGTVGQNI